jgi:hypothetical protein
VPWTRARAAAHIARWAGIAVALVAFWQVGAGPGALLDAVSWTPT